MTERVELVWYKVAELDEMKPDRVKTATAGITQVALVYFEG